MRGRSRIPRQSEPVCMCVCVRQRQRQRSFSHLPRKEAGDRGRRDRLQDPQVPAGRQVPDSQPKAATDALEASGWGLKNQVRVHLERTRYRSSLQPARVRTQRQWVYSSANADRRAAGNCPHPTPDRGTRSPPHTRLVLDQWHIISFLPHNIRQAQPGMQ